MMFEPFFWSKGINDYLNGKHYSCYSSKGRDDMPSVPDADILTLDDIKEAGGYLSGRKIMSGKDTLANSYSADTTYSVCKVNVSGHKRVRFPSVPGTNLVGSVFTDNTGAVVSSIVVPTLSNKFEAGRSCRCHSAALLRSEHRGVRQGSAFQFRQDRGHGAGLGSQ